MALQKNINNIFKIALSSIFLSGILGMSAFAQQESFSSTAKEVRITTSVTDISVGKSPDNKIHVISDDDSDIIGKAFTAKENNNKITIGNINEAFIDEITLLIPINTDMTLYVTSSTGGIEIENVKVKQLVVKNSASDIDIESVNVTSLSAITGSGDIDVTNSTIKKMVGKTLAGDVDVEAKGLATVTFETGSGNINLVTSATVPTIKLTSVTGDVAIVLPKAAKPKYSLKTVTGSVTAPKQNKSTKGSVGVTTTSGNISIKLK